MALLEIQSMTQVFGGLCALSDFNLRFDGGELNGLIGPNGAGKTTVFNLVSGFYKPTQGQILFKGRDTKPMKPHKITALGVARTFQNIRLWHDMTVLDNIRLARHQTLGYNLADALLRTKRYQRAEADIERNAHEILEALQLDRYAHERPRNLPYGMQRRVEIARALAVKPDLLLLDEPAAGLNTSDVDGLIQLIRWIHKEFKLTIWMIEHQMQVVMSLCTWIKVIDFGSTIAEGTPEQIQNNPDVIKAYLGDGTL
ncbi:amino acid/amide ABC transporter ATP-binding protein 1, HAAT family (TC 3.A.1.4.-) [Desulfonatronum thiosulfatophilum]|uniref:Amino acid/amide ABC transporter ATP-binding protein 1, HAAT family (TC 3.A.1.4.-) n=1 Tax=Desulfonatronum thiosulfatophilum TaxID=617002 RepID=A0A1G6E1B3_9BACT|nr:ABC transporter ATP-binding protein [Desulfonatronum thiosulfatophilum]SDB51176.1 amino acid/amide ABC transporter ATP-binding protein 1, HAAT family (TC 3.A.1.4.-) [Desulfonatronum thiosulfatophilum]